MGLKVLIVAINSKYIHSSLAAWYLKENCQGDHDVRILECSINDELAKVSAKVYNFLPDVIAFSCYIWNIEFVKKLSLDMRKLLPSAKQIAGGPEVSFYFENNSFSFDHIIRGEGEIEFSRLINSIWNKEEILLNKENFTLVSDLNLIKSPYTDEMLSSVGNRILYYESSRGCPFSCSYCLSSAFKGVRYFELERVFNELEYISRAGIGLIKFVDRTFNCNKKRATAIFTHIIDNYEKTYRNTVFHFEVAADLFDSDIIALLTTSPDGLIQFEIGIQSTNCETLKEVSRETNLQIVKENVLKLRKNNNINIHLDLIAGLPGEGLESFKKSFEDVYRLKPHMLQLGFLKLLKGTKIRENAKNYGLAFRDYPPYEFLESKDLKFSEVLILKGIEELVDKFYNTNRFSKTLEFLIEKFNSSYEFFRQFYIYLKSREFFEKARSSRECYEFLFEFTANAGFIREQDLIKELLRFDYLKSDNTKNLPGFLKVSRNKSFYEGVFKFFKDENNVKKYLPESIGINSRHLVNNICVEIFNYDIFREEKDYTQSIECIYILFNYTNREKVDGLYRSIILNNKDINF